MYETVVKIYKIPAQARGELQVFLERLSKNVKTPIASITIRGDTIRVELTGPRSQVLESLEAIRNLLREYHVKVGKKVRVYTFSKIESIVGMGIPVDTLEELLKLRGYPARRRAKKSIETTAPREIVEKEAKQLAEAYKKLASLNLNMSKTVAKMVAVTSAYLGVEPSTIIEEAVRLGIVSRESNNKLTMNYVWRGAIRELIKALSPREGST